MFLQGRAWPAGLYGTYMIYDHYCFQDPCGNQNWAHKDKERICDGGRRAFQEDKSPGARVDYRACQPTAVEHKESCRQSHTARRAFASEEKYDEQRGEQRRAYLHSPGFPLIHECESV